jgi:hypothetical protein
MDAAGERNGIAAIRRPSAVPIVGRLFGIDTTTPLPAGAGVAFICVTVSLVTAWLRWVCTTWLCRLCNCWLNARTCSCSASIWRLSIAVLCACAGATPVSAPTMAALLKR